MGPQLTAMTSFTSFFSLSRTASSTAISQKGFMECFTPSVTTPVLSGFTRICRATKGRGRGRVRGNRQEGKGWTGTMGTRKGQGLVQGPTALGTQQMRIHRWAQGHALRVLLRHLWSTWDIGHARPTLSSLLLGPKTMFL